MTKPILNIADVVIQTADPSHAPKGDTAKHYDIRWGEIASQIGARKLGYNLTVVAPGKRNCPFHSHRVEEEMFFILEGSGELRYRQRALSDQNGRRHRLPAPAARKQRIRSSTPARSNFVTLP